MSSHGYLAQTNILVSTMLKTSFVTQTNTHEKRKKLLIFPGLETNPYKVQKTTICHHSKSGGKDNQKYVQIFSRNQRLRPLPNSRKRLTAHECLAHRWLAGDATAARTATIHARRYEQMRNRLRERYEVCGAAHLLFGLPLLRIFVLLVVSINSPLVERNNIKSHDAAIVLELFILLRLSDS